MKEVIMQDNSSNNDPREIWQNQPTETSMMTLEEVRLRVQKLHVKTRKALLGWMAASLLIIGVSVFGMVWVNNPAVRALFAFSIAWSVAGQFFINRKRQPSTMTEDVLNTGLKSYRMEVERRRYISTRFLLCIFGPSVLAIGTLAGQILSFARDRGTLSKTVPFLTMLAVWIVGVFLIRMRDQRELRCEIDDLNRIENSNG
jgi:FtsH-binding integral membrane protein